jgi:hypothetical protein
MPSTYHVGVVRRLLELQGHSFGREPDASTRKQFLIGVRTEDLCERLHEAKVDLCPHVCIGQNFHVGCCCLGPLSD